MIKETDKKFIVLSAITTENHQKSLTNNEEEYNSYVSDFASLQNFIKSYVFAESLEKAKEKIEDHTSYQGFLQQNLDQIESIQKNDEDLGIVNFCFPEEDFKELIKKGLIKEVEEARKIDNKTKLVPTYTIDEKFLKDLYKSNSLRFIPLYEKVNIKDDFEPEL